MMKRTVVRWCRTSCPVFLLFLISYVSIASEKDDPIQRSSDVPVLFKQEQIRGRVTDEERHPLPGVTVRLKGTNTAVSSDANGNYSLNIPRMQGILVFSFLGFETQEINVNTKVIDVVLKARLNNLDEVVIVGYGAQRRGDLTGAIGQVKMDDFARAPVKSFDDALAGRVAGVQVSGNDGQPGEVNNIVIRGGNSVTQDNSPLYVVDGFPLEDADFNTLNPADIESIDVLKDASATAIYGARGANGVIIITTKKGREGTPVINYNAYYGISKITKLQELLSPYEFVKFQLELEPNEAAAIYLKDGQTLESYRNVKGVDFQSQIFSTAPMQNHNLALRGGTKATKYAISGNIFRQDGVFINSDFARNQGRLSLDQTVNKKLKVGTIINVSNSVSTGQRISSDGSGTTSALYAVWGYRPVSGSGEINLEEEFNDPGYDQNVFSDYKVNPVINAKNMYRRDISNSFIVNAYADYELVKDLTLRVTGGLTSFMVKSETLRNSLTNSGARLGPSGSVYNTARNTWLNENTLTYKPKLGNKQSLTVLGGFTMQGQNSDRQGFSASQLNNEALGIDGLEDSPSIIGASGSSRWGLVSYLSRINYSYRSKYLITASFRADGSSKFSEGNKWSYFPSASVAWRMSNENFMKNVSFISDAKLRFSYGATGNNRFSDDFPYRSKLGFNNAYYSFNNGLPSSGAAVVDFSNYGLKWETTYQANAGYDLNLFKDRVSLVFDIYSKTTRDLILNADIPFTTGVSDAYKNIGSVRNQGVEFTVNTENIRNKNFRWSTSFNISFNRNKVLALTDNQETLASTVSLATDFNNLFPYVAIVGQPVAQFYGLIWDGLYQYDDFELQPDGRYLLKDNIATYRSDRSVTRPGDIKYVDINGDRVIDAKDYTVIGKPLPIHIGGISNNFSYKGLDLNVFFQWSYGNKVLNANRLFFEGTNSGRLHLNQFASYANRWTEENAGSNTLPRAGGQGISAYSSRVIEDGSFIRLKTVQLGYNLPAQYIKGIGMKDLRIYVSAQNLITWTGYKGSDPEVSVRNSNLTPGFDFSAYPRARVITFGLNTLF